MSQTKRRPGRNRDGVNDQAGSEVNGHDSRPAVLPVPSLVSALDLLDELDLCACWVAPRRRRCKARWSR